ncbi:UNVERIFIED_CONTAM: hypothetical protein Sradi_2041200 [Sesamum radiatum]|uniref:Uncharacterized protein n=1 Tax=Sesamum radiatum TaxID=300843 RepID=A0AAW2TH97_SESRA
MNFDPVSVCGSSDGGREVVLRSRKDGESKGGMHGHNASVEIINCRHVAAQRLRHDSDGGFFRLSMAVCGAYGLELWWLVG